MNFYIMNKGRKIKKNSYISCQFFGMMTFMRCLYTSVARNSRRKLIYNTDFIFCFIGDIIWLNYRKNNPPKSLSYAYYQNPYSPICINEFNMRYSSQFYRLTNYMSELLGKYTSLNNYDHSCFIARNTTRDMRFRSVDTLMI
jgi:hypothetical protein